MFSGLPTPVWATLAGLYALLLAATGIVLAMRRRRPGSRRELLQRIQSWWVMVTVFAVALALGPGAALVFLGAVSFLALKEYLSLIPTRRADRQLLLWAYLAIPLQFWFIYQERMVIFLIFVPVYMFLWLPMMMVIQGQTSGFLRAAGTLHWGLMICVFAIGHAGYLLFLPGDGNPGAGGAGWLLFLLVLTEINDVAQYVSGRLLGRRKAAPAVSPNKTVEGYLGGLVTSAALSLLLAPVLTSFDWQQALCAGLVIGFAGFMGDVTISALKRDLGVKDAGSLLPGHGGVLDRVDSLTFTAPLFFHYVNWFAY